MDEAVPYRHMNSFSNACDGDTVDLNGHYPVYINNYGSDRKKQMIEFDKKPVRVIANQQNVIETLLALQQEDSILAAACTSGHTTDFLERYKKKAAQLPNISKFDFDTESVLAMEPDFIIGWQSTFSNRNGLRSTYFWNDRNVKTYIVENSNSILKTQTLEDEYKFIKDMGIIFNAEAQADSFIENMQYQIQSTFQKTKNRAKQKVIIIELMGKEISVYGRNRLGGDMVTRLGGHLIECGNRIGQEELIYLNPDIIFVVCTGWKEDALYMVNRIQKNRIYQSINAVKNQRVYAIPLMDMYASATRTMEGIEVFKNGLYPDLAGEP